MLRNPVSNLLKVAVGRTDIKADSSGATVSRLELEDVDGMASLVPAQCLTVAAVARIVFGEPGAFLIDAGSIGAGMYDHRRVARDRCRAGRTRSEDGLRRWRRVDGRRRGASD